VIVDPPELRFVKAAIEKERALVEELTRVDERGEDDSHIPEAHLPAFFGTYPHLMLALDFDEYVVLEAPDKWRSDSSLMVASEYGVDITALVYRIESIYRETSSGAWYIFDGLTWPGSQTPLDGLHFLGPTRTRVFEVEQWLDQLAKFVEQPDSKTRTLWLPGRWTPTSQKDRRSVLKETVDPVISALQGSGRNLRDLHWRELEEVVAELLADRGLEIDVTPRTRDGGRDIVARGELVPGEPMQIAIEVKQKAVVGLEDVQRALYANSAYPALMLATAGTFSAGVVREREANSMRLFLKDGMALRQWLTVSRGPTEFATRRSRVARRNV
jgi:hypothetical protein